MRRHLIGILAIIALLGAAGFWIWPQPGWEAYESACWRMGAVLCAMWLAFPDVRRIPNWALAALPVVLFLLVRFPRQFLFAIPVMIVAAVIMRFLWPRK
jgi:hypothetical protein